jgi:large subunit ribosomal protein L21
MYAIIRTGGKQYKVQAGDVLQVDKLDQDLGAEFKITEVLMIGGDASHIGLPLVKDALVTAVVTKQAKSRKKIVFKKKRRQGYRRLHTHKQEFTELFIKAIAAPGGKTVNADSQPNVVDVTAARLQRIADKQQARKDRAEAAINANRANAPQEPVQAKTTKKKAPAKKAAAKKATTKKPAAKAGAKKKVAKKTTKKS